MGHAPWSSWIDDLVSGELAAEEQAALDAHLPGCDACRAELEVLRSLRQATRRLAGSIDPPPTLDQDVRSALLGGEAERPTSRTSRSWPRWLAAAALALALGGALFRGAGSKAPEDLPSLVLSDYESYREGALPLAIRTSDEAVLGRFFTRLLGFPARVIDLKMMSFTLVGGRVHDLDGRPSALSVYQGSGGRTLMCQMLAGSASELPPPDRKSIQGAFTFSVFRRGSLTAVFWQEGEVLCVLVSAGPPDRVLDLAREKATA